MVEPSDEVRQRLEALLGDEVVGATRMLRGYTPAERWRVELRSGTTVFAKVGSTSATAEGLRLENEVYGLLRAPFMPELLAWEDHPLQPLLVLEDLGAAYWPPPWTPQMIDEVRATLSLLHSTTAPLKSAADLHGSICGGWRKVDEDPNPFLSLKLVTAEWLNRALPILIEASDGVREDGDEVVHLDVRSDNLCRASRGVVLIDWNWACLGSGALDTGFWLPSLRAEGGPEPETILADRPDVAACVSGFFAARAGLPAIPGAPHVRTVQRQQLVPALSWAARELGLPKPT